MDQFDHFKVALSTFVGNHHHQPPAELFVIPN